MTPLTPLATPMLSNALSQHSVTRTKNFVFRALPTSTPLWVRLANARLPRLCGFVSQTRLANAGTLNPRG